jgi:UDP-N-acetylmuramyl tripeptide synthase
MGGPLNYGETNPLMRITALIVGKAASVISPLLGRGSGGAYPGVIAERLHPSIVRELAARVERGATLITGTNGKTTTTKMLGDVLASSGLRVLRNDSGSNLRQGVASTLVHAASVSGHRVNADLALFEVDEATMPRVVADLRPGLICVMNLSRDQLDRYGEVDRTAQMISEALDAAPDARVLLNADDPIVAGLSQRALGRCSFFGVEDRTHGRPARGCGVESARCPKCGAPLEFEYVYFGHQGRWSCSRCGLSRPEPEFCARDVEMHAEHTMATLAVGQHSQRLRLPLAGLHNVYDALAAFACATLLGLAPQETCSALESFVPPFGRSEELNVAGQRVVLTLAKNPIGTQQSLVAALADGAPGPVGFALNDHAADGADVSWIWDVDFESLDLGGHPIVVSGGRADDLMLRLKYAGVLDRDLKCCADPAGAVMELAHLSDGGISHMFATYTAMLEMRTAFAGAGDPFSQLGRTPLR